MISPYTKGKTLIKLNDVGIWDMNCSKCHTMFTEQTTQIPMSMSEVMKLGWKYGWSISRSEYQMCPGCWNV